jgi:hypothetical protein
VTYDLVVAHDSHYTKGLHAILLRVERRTVPIIPKNDVWVVIGVQIIDASIQRFDLVLESRNTLTAGVIGAFATSPVGSVTVNIHVGVLAVALDEDGSFNVTTVGESVAIAAICEPSNELIAA